jgi:lipopolysaccharide/colanic/teichoic acid biosynthesis glycosyltransferase
MITKRVFDVVASTAALIVSAPIWIVVAIAVRATSQGSVLHRSTRVGLNGRPFTLLKFRTMSVQPVQSGHALVTASGDPRITKAGRILRAAKLDEIPQLVNVLRGDMSLVGPRPEDPVYVAGYDDRQRRVLSVRPGMTSPAAIAYRHEERLLATAGADLEDVYIRDVLPAKLELDLSYIDTRTFFGDIAILLRTALAVVKRPPGIG